MGKKATKSKSFSQTISKGVEKNSNNQQPQDENLLSCFWKLASLDESKRVIAVKELINYLNNPDEEQKNVEYTLKRLVKGLGSSRKAARQGFSTALVHVLKNFSKRIDCQTVFNLMNEHLVIPGSCSSQEERDVYFGQVFGNIAISHYLLLDGNTDKEKEKLLNEVVKNLLELMKRKTYLREICARSICNIVTKTSSVLELLTPFIKKEIKDCTAEEIMINLVICKIKNSCDEEVNPEHWTLNNLFKPSIIQQLVPIFLTTTEVTHPRLHSVWDIYIPKALESLENVKTFWKYFIEDGMLKSTHLRKYLAMQMLLRLSPHLSINMVEVVYSAEMMRCIINSCQSRENFLFKAAQEMLKKLTESLDEIDNEDLVIAIIKRFVGRCGSCSFDTLTKTKTVEILTKKINKNIEEYYHWLLSCFKNGSVREDVDGESESTEKDKDSCRRWILNQLVLLAHTCKKENKETVIIQIACNMFLYGYFNVLKKNDIGYVLGKVHPIEMTECIIQFSRQRFHTVLSELSTWDTTTREKGVKTKSVGGISSDGEFFTVKILKFAKKLLEAPKFFQLHDTWTPEIYEAFNGVCDGFDNEDKEIKLTSNEGVNLFIQLSTLQLFENDEEAITMLEDVRQCFEVAGDTKKIKKGEPHWTEVLSEIMLSFLSKPSHLMRNVVDTVFQVVAPHFTEEAFSIILKALEPSMKSNEDGELEIQGEGDDEKEDDDTEEKEEGEKEMEGEDSESSDDSDEEDEDADEDFKMQLQQALGKFSMQMEASNEEKGEGDEDDEDSDLDMDTCDPKLLEAMDQTLSNIFHERKMKGEEKKKQRQMKESIVHFKLRVLDLLEVFVRKQPKDQKIFMLIKPLLDVINVSQVRNDEQNLFERSVGLFKNRLCQLREYPSGKELEVQRVYELMEQLIRKAKKSGSSSSLVSYITEALMYLIRVLRGNPDLKGPSPLKTRSQRKRKVEMEQKTMRSNFDEDRVVKLFQEALQHFMTEKGSSLQVVVFSTLINRFPDLGWHLGVDVAGYLATACNSFRKIKCCELVKLLLSKKTSTYEENLMKISNPLIESMIEFYKAISEESRKFKTKHIREVATLNTRFLAALKNSPTLQVDLTELKEAVNKALESPTVTRVTSVQTQLKQLSTLFDGKISEGSQLKKKTKKGGK